MSLAFQESTENWVNYPLISQQKNKGKRQIFEIIILIFFPFFYFPLLSILLECLAWLEIKCAVCFVSYWNWHNLMIAKYYWLSNVLAFSHLHPGCWMTSGFCLVHWWHQIPPNHLRKGEKAVIIFFRFTCIWRKCIDWRSLLETFAVSIVRSEVLPYNKRSYFKYAWHPIIVGNPQ